MIPVTCQVCGRKYTGLDCLRCTQQAIAIRGFGEETLGPLASQSDILSKTPVSPHLAKLKLGTENQFFAVPKPICRIGSDLSNDIVISDDPDTARFHAQISFDEKENEYALRDLGTKTGTFLNNTQVHLDQFIFGGDLIKIGRYKFYFMSDIVD